MRRPIEIEGAALDELLALPPEEQDVLIAYGRPIAFRMGSAEILAEFAAEGDLLIVSLAHIDGGGEGVLLHLWKAIEAYARHRSYVEIRWNVFAATCARPNADLQATLKTLGFMLADDPKQGLIFTRARRLRVEPSPAS
jgi:hypothetical protein